MRVDTVPSKGVCNIIKIPQEKSKYYSVKKGNQIQSNEKFHRTSDVQTKHSKLSSILTHENLCKSNIHL